MAVAVVVLPASGCETRAPFAPTLTTSWGARVTDGKLQIWTGAPCVAVKKISLSHDSEDAELVLTATDPAGADVEHLTLGGPYPAGLQVTRPWPQGVDWRTAKELTFQLDAFPPVRNRWCSARGRRSPKSSTDHRTIPPIPIGSPVWVG